MTVAGNTVIQCENIGKRYLLGGKTRHYKTLRDGLTNLITSPLSLIRRRGNSSAYKLKGEGGKRDAKYIWALQGVDLTVKEGEVLGIIGSNGAGKSTLLKILTRITDPTTGQAFIKGRVGSLLEVGTGFHPELTGRENIFFNGAILGLTRRDITRKFDEIVDFAGVEEFIETPVKRYSSGMNVRLAFAVAANLEPEIMIIDEVLAVGDQAFQKKCLGIIQKVGREGRTVLFVSHNLAAITGMCSRTILIEDGKITEDGRSDLVVAKYLKLGRGNTAEKLWPDLNSAPGTETIRLRAVRARQENGQITDTFSITEPIYIEVDYDVLVNGSTLTPVLEFTASNGMVAFSTLDNDASWDQVKRKIGKYKSTVKVPGNLLADEEYIVTVSLCTKWPWRKHALIENALAFQVYDKTDGNSARGNWSRGISGIMRPYLDWQTEYTPSS